jgi:hypothetical protein
VVQDPRPWFVHRCLIALAEIHGAEQLEAVVRRALKGVAPPKIDEKTLFALIEETRSGIMKKPESIPLKAAPLVPPPLKRRTPGATGMSGIALVATPVQPPAPKASSPSSAEATEGRPPPSPKGRGRAPPGASPIYAAGKRAGLAMFAFAGLVAVVALLALGLSSRAEKKK